jgi:hypothetical protein
MNLDQKIPAHVEKTAKSFRRVGWLFLIFGSIVAIDPIITLFDANAAIMVNGVPTKDLGTKLAITGFVLIFPILGGLLALSPKSKIEAALNTFDAWAKKFVLDRTSHK